jgi:hypothetical protein
VTQFARLNDGRVVEIIPATLEIEGAAVPLAERFHPDFVAALVEAGPEVALGWVWDGEAFAPPPPPARTESQARAQRDALLSASDWTQLGDAPLTTEQRAAWAAYRAALRAVPGQPGFPAAITWPAAPLD